MPDLTQLVALGSIAYTLVNFIRYVRVTDWSSVVSQLLAWGAGVCATILVAHTDLAAAFTFGGKNLGQIGWLAQFLVGLAAASSIGVVYQFTKAVDATQNAKVPSILPGSSAAQSGNKPVPGSDAAADTERPAGG